MSIEIEIDQMINAESGVQVVVNGSATDAYIIPMLDGMTSLDGDTIEHSGPFAIASMADVDQLGLSTGDNGDTLTINGGSYTVLSINPDGQGGAILRLEEQP
jgi:hypothetical protein